MAVTLSIEYSPYYDFNRCKIKIWSPLECIREACKDATKLVNSRRDKHLSKDRVYYKLRLAGYVGIGVLVFTGKALDGENWSKISWTSRTNGKLKMIRKRNTA